MDEGFAIFWLDAEEIDGRDVVDGLDGECLGRVDDGEIVEGRDKDEDRFLFLRQLLDPRC